MYLYSTLKIGRVYRYDVWFDDSEKIEEYLTDMGHSIQVNIEWMVTRNKKVIK